MILPITDNLDVKQPHIKTQDGGPSPWQPSHLIQSNLIMDLTARNGHKASEGMRGERSTKEDTDR